MRGVQEDLHDSSRLAATIRPLQLLPPAAGFGVGLPDRLLGAIGRRLHGPQSIAGSNDASPVGLAEAD